MLAVSLGLLTGLVAGPNSPVPTVSAQAPVGQGFNLNKSDLNFILKQIKISEIHAKSDRSTNLCNGLLGDNTVVSPGQIPNNGVGVTLPWGLRTVDGTCNNLLQDGAVNQTKFGAADQLFPRHVPAQFKTQPNYAPTPGQPAAVVNDPQPRRISNLIVDQSPTNPSAVDAAGDDLETPEVEVPLVNGSYFIPNVAPDTGLSAPYNSWFTLFGQFFDHGLDLVNKGNAGTVFVPLDSDDPLFPVPGGLNFMVLTRATNVAGEATNQTTPFVDQSQTYTSHPSHQVFLRDYDLVLDDPTDPENLGTHAQATGRLITGPGGGMADWAAVKLQAETVLGIAFTDQDVFNIPLVATDPYGHFIPGANGFPQLVGSDGVTLTEGNPDAPITTANTMRTNHAFLDDIAHNANPNGKTPDLDGTVDPITVDGQPAPRPAGTYDDELLDTHFIAGDGRVNENIGLTAVHHVFHSEHNRLAEEIDGMLHDPALFSTTELAEWTTVSSDRANWDYAERLFQAARFVTEMEYQHLAFEEFIRKVQPMVNLFGEGGTGYHTEINPAIRAEFAHAVYRFGHSMLTESVDRSTPDGIRHDLPLLDAFLNPPAFFDNADSPEAAAGNIVRGMTRQVGNELDEFITGALRNRLLGLPLDLATLNLSRARDTGIPGLNPARRAFFAESDNTALTPYTSWADFSFNIRHMESLQNFIAAYGTHADIVNADGRAAKRAAAENLIAIADESGIVDSPELDAYNFLNSIEGTPYASLANGVTTTGVDDIDLWAGGLAETQQAFGGLLGATFNYVFENQMENLQDGDRFYYLSRTAGLNLLTQLEGNSFAELIQRNTDVEGLPADSFSRPDYIFNLAAENTSGPIIDDPTTPDINEAANPLPGAGGFLSRQPGGQIRYFGPAHVVFNGRDTSDVPAPLTSNDNIVSSEGDDTLRGNSGVDRLEGANGVDNIIGGEGDDFLLDGGVLDDTLKGGPGNDYLSSGQGLGGDLNQGGTDHDFIVGGNDITEHFGGPGNDLVFAGQAEDTVFGDDGDDWEEGGLGPFNLLQGDNGAPFQDDPNEAGHDVMDSDGGEQDFDAEGGDDIMLMGGGIQRAEGMLGFDWATHRSDPSPANSDMEITVADLPSVETNRDRFDRVEALSGWNFNDTLRGDSRATLGAGDPENDLTGHELSAEGIARIVGLEALTGTEGFTGGNIILGGAGNDLIEGRGGNDVIDGDRWLDAQLLAPNVATAATDDTLLFDGLGVGFTDATGVHNTLRADVAAGRINPGAISIFRSIKTPPAASTDASMDVALFSGPLADYDILEENGVVTVTHARGLATDGIDTLRNIEIARFTDAEENFGVLFNRRPTGTVTLSSTTPVEDVQLSVLSAVVNDPDGPASPVLTFVWQREVDEVGSENWLDISDGPNFTPTDAGVGHRLRVLAKYNDRFGVPEEVPSAPTEVVESVNDAPTGLPVLSTDSPVRGTAMTVDLTGIADVDGLGTLSVQWLRDAGTVINGATDTTYNPTNADVNHTLRVRVSYTDGQGWNELLLSDSTGTVQPPPIAIMVRNPASLAFGTRARGAAPTTQVVTVTNNGGALLTVTGVTRTGTNPTSFSHVNGCGSLSFGESCQVSVSFLTPNNNTVGAIGPKSATLNIASTAGPQTVALSGTVVANAATQGVPAINDGTPAEGQLLTASVAGITDGNGLTKANTPNTPESWNYQWQQNDVGGAGTYVNIPGETGPTFTPAQDQVNRRLRVQVRAIDDNGATTGLRTSAQIQVVSDVFVGTAGADSWLTATAQADTASGGDGNDTLPALGGNDVVSGDGGNDTINGGDGTDAIDGGADNDTINGGAGNDTVSGGAGNDAINTSAGDDVVVVRPGDGTDTVTGFDFTTTAAAPGQDRINISAFGGSFANVSLVDGGTNVVVTITTGLGTASVNLLGVPNVGSITAQDFVL